MSARVAEFVVRSAIEPWQRIGLHVVDGVAYAGSVRLRFEPPATDADAGLASWGLVGSATPATDIDGLVTSHLQPFELPATANALDIVGFDHVVVNTSSLDRTCGAIEAATGAPLKRIRDAGPGIRQGFHRLGEVIVEVVESPRVQAPTASFWGFVWNVADLHEMCERLGPDVVSLPKAAVQPGRFIATVRASVGLGLPLALMTP